LDSSWFHEFVVPLRGKDYMIRSRPGVFSWDRLDPGTKALIEVIDIPAVGAVLDLGCGYGIIGAVAASLAPGGQALLLDADVTAVEAAGHTLARNGVKNGSARLSDCGEAVRDKQFDVVATNPPFHQGMATSQAVARQFITDAAEIMAPGGSFYLVANKFLPYEKQLAELFGLVEPVYVDARYKVLLARR
jgi:16S rRNA (guanine1207-N2)-methyltransferase